MAKPYGKEKTGYSKTIGAILRDIKRDWQLHALLFLPVVYVFIFKYWPMYGVQIAFRDYKAVDGIMGSEFVGLKWFKKFIESHNFESIFSNTVILSLYSILVNFFLAVFLALMINTIRNRHFKKIVQTVTYIPHFISVVVIVSILNQVFNPVNGLYGSIYRFFGGKGYPYDFRGTADSFRHLYVWSGVWQNLGWDTIVYIAALSAVSPEYHEAAVIDGASRWQRVWHVDLPAILPTACIMFILRCGSVMSIGFEKVYLMQGTLNKSTSEVISTHVYKVAMGAGGDFSYGAAIGLFNSVINCAIVIFANWFSKRMSRNEVSLF